MNENEIIPVEKHGVPPIIPTDVFNIHIFNACNRIAEIMAKAALVPQHLRDKHADCFIIAQQSYRWQVDPFAVAQCTSLVSGKLCYEGKLVAAIVEKLAGVTLNYEYSGSGDTRAVKVIGQRKTDTTPVDISIAVKDVKTNNEKWRTMTDQMLAYRGAREWARRYTPGVLLGIYTDDELSGEGTMKNVSPSTSLDSFEEKFSKNARDAVVVESTPLDELRAITVLLGDKQHSVPTHTEAAKVLIENLERYKGADYRRTVLDKNSTLINEIYSSGLKEEAMKIAAYAPAEEGRLV